MNTYAPGHIYTILAATAIDKQLFVGLTGNICAADAKPLGVTEYDVASGEHVAVMTSGVALIKAGAALSAGARLKVDGTGRAITWATSGEVAGWALDDASGANEVIRVLLA